MTAFATVPNAPALNHGNWERYMVALKGHEEWVLHALDNWHGYDWWSIDPATASPHASGGWCRAKDGWIKIEGQGAINFGEYEEPFFRSPRAIYKLMRACIRRRRAVIPDEEQKEAWAWAQENLVVYKFTLNLVTLQSTKEVIDFRTECCPKSISRV